MLLAVSLSACQGPNPGYFQYGIGTELPAADIAQAGRLQTQYFQYLCEQAGFPTSQSAGGGPSRCTLPLYDRGTWTLIVQQGMNDIDRRCDAYLQWLDDRKRSKGPLLSQIKDVQTATTSIMAIVDPNSAVALQIVAIAFNLLSRSIENYDSRLLDEIESSTINSVVLRARHDFRRDVQGKAFSNRPEAEYALREYMKRCLPFAIETQINDLSTLGSRGISPNEGNTIFQEPVLGAQLLEDTPPSAGARIERTEPPPVTGPSAFDTMFSGAIEQNYSKPGVQEIQRKLCVPESGRFDDPTRAAIKIAEQAIGSSRPNGIIDTGTEEDVIRAEKDGCQTLGFANTFEKFHFRGDDTMTAKTKIERFQSGLFGCVVKVERVNAITWPDKPANEAAFISGVLDGTTRSAIKFASENIKAEEQASESGVLTDGMIGAIQGCVVIVKPQP